MAVAQAIPMTRHPYADEEYLNVKAVWIKTGQAICTSAASWFETRGIASLLTMRV